MGMWLLFLLAFNILVLLFVLILFNIIPSFVTADSENKEYFKKIYFKAIKSAPIGLILGAAISYSLSLSEHPDLNFREINPFSIWLSKFPITAAVVLVIGLLNQLIYCFSELREFKKRTQ